MRRNPVHRWRTASYWSATPHILLPMLKLAARTNPVHMFDCHAHRASVTFQLRHKFLYDDPRRVQSVNVPRPASPLADLACRHRRSGHAGGNAALTTGDLLSHWANGAANGERRSRLKLGLIRRRTPGVGPGEGLECLTRTSVRGQEYLALRFRDVAG